MAVAGRGSPVARPIGWRVTERPDEARVESARILHVARRPQLELSPFAPEVANADPSQVDAVGDQAGHAVPGRGDEVVRCRLTSGPMADPGAIKPGVVRSYFVVSRTVTGTENN